MIEIRLLIEQSLVLGPLELIHSRSHFLQRLTKLDLFIYLKYIDLKMNPDDDDDLYGVMKSFHP